MSDPLVMKRWHRLVLIPLLLLPLVGFSGSAHAAGNAASSLGGAVKSQNSDSPATSYHAGRVAATGSQSYGGGFQVMDLTSAVDTAPTGSDIITNSGSVVQTGNGAHSTNDIKGTILRSFNTNTAGMEGTSTFISPEERPPQVFFNDAPIISERETLDIDEFGFSPFGFEI